MVYANPNDRVAKYARERRAAAYGHAANTVETNNRKAKEGLMRMVAAHEKKKDGK